MTFVIFIIKHWNITIYFLSFVCDHNSRLRLFMFHRYVCVSGGKKCSFFGKFGVLGFFETPVLRFALLLYYWRVLPGQLFVVSTLIWLWFLCLVRDTFKIKWNRMKNLLLFFSIRQFYILLELVTSNVTIAKFQLSVNCISKVSEFWIRNILQWVLRLNLKKHQITNSYDKTLDFKEGENIIRSI